MAEQTERLVVELAPELKRELKILAAYSNKTMTEIVEDLIREAVKNKEYK